jgi:hypothetical protein
VDREDAVVARHGFAATAFLVASHQALMAKYASSGAVGEGPGEEYMLIIQRGA